MVANHWELGTCPKFDLVEVEKIKFQGYDCHFELIFGVLIISKSDLGEFEKGMFKVSNGILNLFSAYGLDENAI